MLRKSLKPKFNIVISQEQITLFKRVNIRWPRCSLWQLNFFSLISFWFICIKYFFLEVLFNMTLYILLSLVVSDSLGIAKVCMLVLYWPGLAIFCQVNSLWWPQSGAMLHLWRRPIAAPTRTQLHGGILLLYAVMYVWLFIECIVLYNRTKNCQKSRLVLFCKTFGQFYFSPEKRWLIVLGIMWLDITVWRSADLLCRVIFMLAMGGSSLSRG